MAKKRKRVAADGADSLAHAVLASAQPIWQAWLGAVAATRQEGGKRFDTLVHDGAQLHRLTRKPARGKIGRLAGDVARQANASWERIEQYVEARVAQAPHCIGVPSRDEAERLRHDVHAPEAAIRLADAQPLAHRPANREQEMKNNVGMIDRILRVVAGLLLLGLAAAGDIGAWGWIGVVPLLTGVFAVCPLYSVLGIRTCHRPGRS